MLQKPVLVSGGDGFIGTSLVGRLLDQGYSVLVIDNNITSVPTKICDPNFMRIKEDISLIIPNDIPQVGGIIHLASVAAPLVYKQNPGSVMDPNTLGTRVLIEIAKRDKVKLLFASTSEVYGHLSQDSLSGKGIKEDDSAYISLLSSRSCYAAAKRLGEELIFHYKKSGGNASSFRLFNVYGKGMDLKYPCYGRVVPNFFNKLCGNEAIDIFGDGRQIRSFLWIDDAIDAILGLFLCEKELQHVVNIGKDESISIIELARKIAKILGKELRINYKEKDEDDPMWRRPNIDLITRLIGWVPKVSLEEGLKIIAEDQCYAGDLEAKEHGVGF